MSDPQAQWSECDSDGKGMVLFDEFAQWAINKNLDLDDDDDDDNLTDDSDRGQAKINEKSFKAKKLTAVDPFEGK